MSDEQLEKLSDEKIRDSVAKEFYDMLEIDEEYIQHVYEHFVNQIKR
jgi:hypothetical protein